MGLTAGFILCALAIGMLLIARPADGESARFLKAWIVGQIYAMTVMVLGVMGVTLVITDFPF